MTPIMPKLCRFALLALIPLAHISLAQTLARPGWAGSGMNSDPWWKHAIVYQLDPKGFSHEGLQGVSQRLSYIQSLGSDAILLDGITSGNIDPAIGTTDDLDDLIHQASNRSLRVLIGLDPKAPDLTSVARLWLTHGVAGFYVPAATPAQIDDLRKLNASFVGQRILVGDVDPSDNQQGRTPDSPQLLADPRPGTVSQLTAAAVRPGFEASQVLAQSGHATPLLLSDGPTYPRSFSRYADGIHDIAIAKTLAAILLATRTGSLLYYGQELGLASASPQETPQTIYWEPPPKPKPGMPPEVPKAGPYVPLQDADRTSLLNWYRQLSALHHSNQTMRSGEQIVLNHDDKNILAWVRKPQSVSQQTPAIVIVCNLSPQPVTISLKADMQKLHLRGSFLRPVLRSDNAMGAMHLDGMTIAPYMVYIGELRF